MVIKPILFSTPMVQAILEGRKTMTRRVIKPQPMIMANGKPLNGYNDSMIKAAGEFPTPKYQPGDILWVRETWQEIFETEYNIQDPGNPFSARDMIKDFDALPKTCAGLSRECSCASMPARNKYYVYAATPPEYTTTSDGLYWKPSIHMPKEAARIFLRVTGVRVEKLQSITDEDGKREGVCGLCYDAETGEEKYDMTLYKVLWDGYNAKRGYGWGTNPWVWVYSFERVDKPAGWPGVEGGE